MAAASAPLAVTLLGSGSPSPSLARCHPAAVVSWGERHVLVDAGDGVVAQLLRAGIPTGSVEHVAITHLHWDHVLGYPAFVWGSWMSGWYETSVDDVEPGWVTELDGCTISAGAVVHPPMAAVAYRFSYEGRSLVISGDTAACDELVAFARGADLLVVDACAADPPPDAPPARQELIRRLRRFHAAPQECVDMAASAETAAVVLTHHLPEADVEVDTSGYRGTVHVGADLDHYVA